MKTIVIGCLLLTPVMAGANDGAKAFATGFANALNRSMGGNPNDSRPEPTPQVEATVYQQPVVSYHYDAVINVSNTRGGYYFFNYGECNRFLNGNGRGVYDECIRVGN